jgi:hypothetical protein
MLNRLAASVADYKKCVATSRSMRLAIEGARESYGTE